jgi:hypothetical protein
MRKKKVWGGAGPLTIVLDIARLGSGGHDITVDIFVLII